MYRWDSRLTPDLRVRLFQMSLVERFEVHCFNVTEREGCTMNNDKNGCSLQSSVVIQGGISASHWLQCENHWYCVTRSLWSPIKSASVPIIFVFTKVMFD